MWFNQKLLCHIDNCVLFTVLKNIWEPSFVKIKKQPCSVMSFIFTSSSRHHPSSIMKINYAGMIECRMNRHVYYYWVKSVLMNRLIAFVLICSPPAECHTSPLIQISPCSVAVCSFNGVIDGAVVSSSVLHSLLSFPVFFFSFLLC